MHTEEVIDIIRAEYDRLTYDFFEGEDPGHDEGERDQEQVREHDAVHQHRGFELARCGRETHGVEPDQPRRGEDPGRHNQPHHQHHHSQQASEKLDGLPAITVSPSAPLARSPTRA